LYHRINCYPSILFIKAGSATACNAIYCACPLIAGKWHGIAVLRDIAIRKKAQQEIEQALNIQLVLDTILNISLPPLTLKEVVLKSLDALLQSCARLAFGHCLCGKAAAIRKLVFFNHLNEQHEIRYDGIQPHGHYCIPVISDGRLLGVLNVYVAAGHISEESERRFLKTVADTLAVVIERKQAEE